MKKAIRNLSFTLLLLVMITTVISYLAPHFGWQRLSQGIITDFLNTANGFFLGLVVPTVIFTALYVRTILRFLKESKTRELGEIANK